VYNIVNTKDRKFITEADLLRNFEGNFLAIFVIRLFHLIGKSMISTMKQSTKENVIS
jgi:hypothetical protein